MAPKVNRLIVALFVLAALVALGACSGGGGGGILPTGPTDPGGSGGGGVTTVSLDNIVYHRTKVVNPNKTAADFPGALGVDDIPFCGGNTWSLTHPENWDVANQDWHCGSPIEGMKTGVVHLLIVDDTARFNGTIGSEGVCSQVSIGGTVLKPTYGSMPAETCYFTVNAAGVITSTDATGKPIS